ncbi:nitrate ABC transporter substrate-binding protein [Saccharomonospora sp. CUA-673]|uniref:ABC transporter substrate-binding protein n=1 Tax=Saccharomonospora sp. CUA-673 TaxID=1904969 RepID=UPI00095D18AF|nr:ABC transporter substrate-binding protein [Saccharomonospora sp. CUA-673]OLT47007.1 nitrate ABC transporter substrate-binding protein [Saccharomonospora sp. CUA-673]
MLTACAGGSTATGAAEIAEQPLPADVPAGTDLVVADQNEEVQTLMRASGEHDNLASTAEYTNFLGGPAILEAIRAGSVDVAAVGDTPPIQAHASGETVPIVAAKLQSKPDYRIAVRPGVTVETLEDLEGKKVAYGEGTGRQTFVLRALREAGLTTDDVELVPLRAADFPDSIRTEQVDVAVLNEPHFTRYLRDYGDQGATAVPDSELENVASGLQFLYARGDALTDPAKAAAIRDFVQRWITAAQWSQENEAEWIQAYYVDNAGLSEEDGQAVVDSQGEFTYPRLDGSLVEFHQDAIDLIHAAGDIPEELDAAEQFDSRFDEAIDDVVADIGATRGDGP